MIESSRDFRKAQVVMKSTRSSRGHFDAITHHARMYRWMQMEWDGDEKWVCDDEDERKMKKKQEEEKYEAARQVNQWTM